MQQNKVTENSKKTNMILVIGVSVSMGVIAGVLVSLGII